LKLSNENYDIVFTAILLVLFHRHLCTLKIAQHWEFSVTDSIWMANKHTELKQVSPGVRDAFLSDSIITHTNIQPLLCPPKGNVMKINRHFADR
jgi:hypothetical protein